MTRIIVSPEAEADLIEIETHICDKASAEAAARITQRILATIVLLGRVPLASGRLIPALGPGIRCHPHGNYNIYLRYQAEVDELQVVRILHARRNITAALFKP